MYNDLIRQYDEKIYTDNVFDLDYSCFEQIDSKLAIAISTELAKDFPETISSFNFHKSKIKNNDYFCPQIKTKQDFWFFKKKIIEFVSIKNSFGYRRFCFGEYINEFYERKHDELYATICNNFNNMCLADYISKQVEIMEEDNVNLKKSIFNISNFNYIKILNISPFWLNFVEKQINQKYLKNKDYFYEYFIFLNNEIRFFSYKKFENFVNFLFENDEEFVFEYQNLLLEELPKNDKMYILKPLERDKFNIHFQSDKDKYYNLFAQFVNIEKSELFKQALDYSIFTKTNDFIFDFNEILEE